MEFEESPKMSRFSRVVGNTGFKVQPFDKIKSVIRDDIEAMGFKRTTAEKKREFGNERRK